ncbi:MAG: carbamate kinase [Negativicutes bacterium]|nr:carbamate kinase [Negativicutes bacterium]
MSKKTLVLAFGGNAIVRSDQRGTKEEQWGNLRQTCSHIVNLVKEGHRVVLTHGNGPQVGNLMIKNERSKDVLPVMPMDVLGANTQGALGYGISQLLINALDKAGLRNVEVATVVTQVLVGRDDPAWQNPTKYVGPFFSEEEAKKIMAEKGHVFKPDANRGWRRVVPSPLPRRIVEKDVIRLLVDNGVIVVACGGGGIPVVETPDGYEGVEAVIDKDRAGVLLAEAVNADAYFLMTEVERVAINFGRPNQQEFSRLSVAEAEKYMVEGHFPPGSMGPKMEAAIAFAKSKPGRQAVIVSLEKAHLAFTGQSGTIVEM